MTAVLNKDGTLAITAMSLVEFLPEVEQAIYDGFTLDLAKNEGTPQQFGTMLVLTMYPAGDVQVQDTNEEDDSKYVITPKTNLAEVTQPVGEEVEKVLQGAIPPLEVQINILDLKEVKDIVEEAQKVITEVIQETPMSTEVVQPVKVDGRKRKV